MEEQKEAHIPEARDSHIRARRVWLVLFLGALTAALMAGNVLYGIFLQTRTERSFCLSCHEYMGPGRMWNVSDRAMISSLISSLVPCSSKCSR